jgi:hypothetical protein
MSKKDRAKKLKGHYSTNKLYNRFVILPKQCNICSNMKMFQWMKVIKHLGFVLEPVTFNIYICEDCFNVYFD